MTGLFIKLKKLKNLTIQRVQRFLFNRHINHKFLNGEGMEVGPGEHPFSVSKKTIFLEKFVDDYDVLFPKADKQNFINGEAENVPADDDSFDFLVSAHCLEHCIDPIAVLKEFKRVVKSSGLICLILPHCERTFDKGRFLSTLEGHIHDHENQVTKEDYLKTEGKYFDIFEEFLLIATKWPRHNWISGATNKDGSWNKRKILEEGILHYHVWTQNEVIDLLRYLDCSVNFVKEVMPGRPDSFIVIAEVKK